MTASFQSACAVTYRDLAYVLRHAVETHFLKGLKMATKRQQTVQINTSGNNGKTLFAPPPQDTGDYWPVINIGIDAQDFVILSSSWYGLFCHFTQWRTMACTRDLGQDCEFCGSIGRRWIGYLAVTPRGKFTRSLLTLTPNAVNNCKRLVENTDLQRRGIELSRVPRTKRGKVVARVSADRVTPADYADLIVDAELLEKQVCILLGLRLVREDQSAFADPQSLPFGE